MMKIALLILELLPLIDAACMDGFNQTSQGCFKTEDYVQKSWSDAEATCQQYGSNVHLATIDTQEVGTLIYLDMYGN